MQNQNIIPSLSTASDEQLVSLSSDSLEAMEELITRYSRLVRAAARPLFLTGGDHEDLVQEGMIGLLHAVRSYSVSAGTPFPAYALVCIRNKMISAVRAATASKHAPLNDSVPIQPFSFDLTVPVGMINDPETEMISRECADEFLETLGMRLSASERTVLSLYLQGLSYSEIADRIRKTPKSVDNAVQRIRKKAASILGENGPAV